MSKTSPTWWHRFGGLVIAAILAFSFVTRIWQLHLPTGYVFDEVYHSVTAKLIARNDPQAFEWWNPPIEPNTAVDWLHPPFAKYTQAMGMLLLGENSLGWRISSVFFGVAVIWLTYKLALELFKSEALAATAAGLASLDGLLLVMSRIAMNDIHVTFCILGTLWLYLRHRRKLAPLWQVGLFAGLAMGTKWSGLFVLIFVWMWEVQRVLSWWLNTTATKRHKAFAYVRDIAKKVITRLLCLVVLPLAIYFMSYSLMFIQGKDLHHLYALHQQIWWYQTGLSATHTYQSRPAEWFFNWRPVWFYVSYGDDTIGNIYAFGNPALQWFGVISVVGSVGFLAWKWLHHPRKLLDFLPLTVLLVAYFSVWLPWVASPRIMFYYHYTPAVPLLSIIVAYWLVEMWKKGLKSVSIAVVLVCLLAFGVWYPNWTAIKVPTAFAQAVYFILPNWH